MRDWTYKYSRGKRGVSLDIHRDENLNFFSSDPDPAKLRKKILIRIQRRIRP